MKKTLIALAVMAASPLMANDCVLEDRTVAISQVTIDERSPIRRDIVPMPNGGKKCIVDFRVRVGPNWHTAFGEYSWPNDRPSSEACAIAVDRAENAVRERVGSRQTASQKTLVCKDRPELKELRQSTVGTVGDVGQFRPHPDYPKLFYHNGAKCRWFLEPSFTGQDIRTFQGIVCQIDRQQWVVVDKF